jgi:Translation initiation factor IF-2, N-terminal region
LRDYCPVVTDDQPTLRDLSLKLNVSMVTLVKGLMNLGVMKTATQPLTREEVDFLTKLVRSAPDD